MERKQFSDLPMARGSLVEEDLYIHLTSVQLFPFQSNMRFPKITITCAGYATAKYTISYNAPNAPPNACLTSHHELSLPSLVAAV